MQLYRSDLINRGVTVLLLLERTCRGARRPRAAAAGAAEPGDQRLRRHGRLAGERKLTIISRSLGETEVEFSVWDVGPACRRQPRAGVRALRHHQGRRHGPGPVGVQDDREEPRRRIWAQDNDGAGASFHVALPAQVRAGAAAGGARSLTATERRQRACAR
jgi:hypothetical protein